MSPVARQRPDWLDSQVRIGWNGSQRWKSPDGARVFTYDHLHGHIEVFNKRGVHVGVADIRTGQLVAGAVKGRRIDV